MATASWGRSLADAGAGGTMLPTLRRPGDDASPSPSVRTPGKLAHDSSTERDGEIMYITRVDFDPMIVWLRPVDGGQEWTALAKHVRLIQPGEAGDRP